MMNKFLAAILPAMSCALNTVAATTVAVWDAAQAGASIAEATDWKDGGWQGGAVPGGENWSAVFLTNATGVSYVKVSEPLTLNSFKTRKYKTGGADQVVLVSDSGITITAPSEYSTFNGGRIFADITGGGTGRIGYTYPMELNGRLAAVELVMANELLCMRLDHFTRSSSPLRDNDLVLNSIYRGSGYFTVAGPRKGAAHQGEWLVTAGSPYVSRTGATPKIAAGAIVSCEDVFPVGTFVKRIFSDNLIELSQAAASTCRSGIKTLSFAAITPKTVIRIPELKMITYSRTYVSFGKHEEDDDFRVETDSLYATRLADANGPARFCPHYYGINGLYPATVVIRDAAGGGSGYHADKYANSLLVELGNCHLEFDATGREGALPGFPDSTAVTCPAATVSTRSRLTVTNNIRAVIGNMTNFYHIIEKDGLGSLTINLTKETEHNTGTLIVKEGEVVLPAGSWVKTVAVSNGATLRISGVFAPGKFVAEAGARVVGEGVLSLPDVSSAQGVIFAEGACLQVPGVSELRTEAPATNVPASVAFWVDASRFDTMTFNDDDGTNVLRITDVRGEAYGFATNTAAGFPKLVRDHRSRPHHIDLPWLNSANASMDPAQCMALVWDKPYTNIRAVFQVLETRDGGGQFLGMTKRISGNDYMRPGEHRNNLTAPIFYINGCAAVRGGPFYVNGRRYNPDNGYPYPGGGTSRKLEDGTDAKWCVPTVFSAHPTADTKADAFGFNGHATNRSGFHRVCECLIFTNEVTETERLAITGYLMKKWMNHEVEFEVVDGNPFVSVDTQTIGGLAAGAGESHYVENISGEGTFSKRGEGTVFMNDHVCPDGSLDIAEGTLQINSRLPERADIPHGAHVHFDASDASTLTVKSSGQVSEWRDVRGEGYHKAVHLYSATGYATMTATPRGMSAVDFGRYKGHEKESWADKHDSPIMQYPACGELHSVFMVMDSSQGGGVLVGCGQDPTSLRGPNYGYGLRRFETTGALSYSEPILTNANWTGQKSLLYEGGSRARLNGQRINPLTTGFSGGWDLVSLVSYEDFGGGSFAAANYNKYVGGQAVGEAILYKEGLSERQVDTVEAYLNWKWFGKVTPGFRPAAVSNLTVRAGATLAVTGGQPLTVNGRFSSSGTVQGALAFASSAEFAVTVEDDGSICRFEVAGDVDMSKGGVIRVTGALSTLVPGDYTLLTAASLASGKWNVILDGELRRNLGCEIRTDGNSLTLSVKAPGMTLIVR